MRFHQVLPVIPVRDLTVATSWYEKLLGRPADARPMESLAEWSLTDTATLQVFHDAANAGHAELNMTVDSVDEADANLRGRGVVPGEIVEASRIVRILPVSDPDGNTITFLETR